MYLSSTKDIAGKKSVEHFGLVQETVINGTFFVKDIFSAFRDFFGGRSRSYEQTLEDSRNQALTEISIKAQRMGANAIVGIHFDTGTVRGSMMMVTVEGTAIRVED